MKTVGLIPSQTIVSLLQDGDGGFLNVPTGQTVVPLVELDKPVVSPGFDFAAYHVWLIDPERVERRWQQVAVPLPEAPPAARYQVMEYLMRKNIPLESIPSLIADNTPEGIELDVAIMRWNEVPNFPKEHPLVAAVANALNLDLDVVWASILAIE